MTNSSQQLPLWENLEEMDEIIIDLSTLSNDGSIEDYSIDTSGLVDIGTISYNGQDPSLNYPWATWSEMSIDTFDFENNEIWKEISNMSDHYPGLKIAYEKFKDMIILVKDDWKTLEKNKDE